MNSNRTVVDLQKVAYANLLWKTQDNCYTRNNKPKYPTVHNQRVDDGTDCVCEIQVSSKEVWPRETKLERAKRRGLLDCWIPHCILQLSNSHSLTYTGAKALSLWDAWCAKQFGKTKKKK